MTEYRLCVTYRIKTLISYLTLEIHHIQLKHLAD